MKHRHDRIQFLSLSIVCTYPDYPGELDAMGKVTVGFTKGDSPRVILLTSSNAWASCDSPGEVLGLVWNPVVVQDLWTTAGGAVYNSDLTGVADG